MAVRSSKPGEGQLPLFLPESNWRPPEMSSLPNWGAAKRIAIDCETHDAQLTTLGIGVRRGAYAVGYSVAIEDGPSFYLPTRHEGGDNLDEAQVLGYMREQARQFKGDIVGANLSYDLDYLWDAGIEFDKAARFRDIQIADPLIYELHMSYSLANIGARHGVGAKDEALLKAAAQAFNVDAKKGLWKLPARYVGQYAEQDARLPLAVLRSQETMLDRDNLWDIWNLESRVLPILVKLRRRGVRINADKLDQIELWAKEEERKALAVIKDATGLHYTLDQLTRTDVAVQILQAIGVPADSLPRTSTGKDSVDKGVLARLKGPVPAAVLHGRKVNKLRNTFVESIRRYMVNGRIHCTFNQIARETEGGDQQGARYGRLSAVDPNMQQQPSRDDFAKMWRSIYIPEDGKIWGCLDYSQQEPRWTTHFAASTNLDAQRIAQEAAQAYWDDPKLDNHDFMAKLTGLPRKYAKNIYLGLCYGEGGYKLCEDLGLPTRWAVQRPGRGGETWFHPTRMLAMQHRSELNDGKVRVYPTAGEEGQNILNTFDARAPFIKQLANKATERARARGYIVTAGGRRLHFPTDDRGNYEWTHKALNRLIQGSSADQMKTAMVTIDDQMPDVFIQLQVHDELDGSFDNREQAEAVAQLMREAIPGTKVPFRVDVEMGPSWGEAE